ncbi:hypothetical protein [Ferrimonas futtsuensis]|uniref:hypothetical protein n=1 Tax=Ferrimonas futtsuensis TaxID=364764 RepID=UPI00041E8B3E|nr:hypothetical protein [Ferrimonas futtsuensis]
MTSRKPKLTTAVIGALIMTGCVSTGPKREVITSLPNIPIQDTEYMPAKLLDSSQKKVIVMPTKVSATGVNQAAIQSQIQGQIENSLAGAGIFAVDRESAKTLKEELLLAETTGKLNYDGPHVADFAIFSTVTTASISTKQTDGGTDLLTGKETGPKCVYNSKVSGQLRILSIPELNQVNTAEMKGTDSSVEAFYGHCSLTKSKHSALLSNASGDAVEHAQTEIRNSLAPMGYVIERRGNQYDNVFRVSLGAARGAKEGDSVEIKRKKITALGNGESITEFETIAHGKFTGAIEPMFSWIVLNKKEQLEIIRRGDLVKLKHEDNIFEMADKGTKDLREMFNL